jgi:hypothetical protein
MYSNKCNAVMSRTAREIKMAIPDRLEMFFLRKERQMKAIKEDREEFIDDDARLKACGFELDKFSRMQALLVSTQLSKSRQLIKRGREDSERLLSNEELLVRVTNAMNIAIDEDIKKAKLALAELQEMF